MAKNIEPTLRLISNYLKLAKKENFVIPEYQRGYSWDETQCDKLWQSIESFMESGSSDPYFFGTIIIDCSDTNVNSFHLIDGQQRTTTFLLLLKALLIRLTKSLKEISRDEDSEALIAGLSANRNKIMAILYKAEDEEIPGMLKDSELTKNILILENRSINELYPNEVKNIIEAVDFSDAEKNVVKFPRKKNNNKYTNYFRNFKFFFAKLGEKNEPNLNKFAKTFLEKCQVIEIRSWQVEQAITMFNSLNSTGLPLSDADIISAKLYSNAGDDKSSFNEKWKQIILQVNLLASKRVVDIDDVLQQYMYILRAKNKEYININNEGNESVDVTTPGLRRYFNEIRQEVLKEPFKFCEDVEKIASTWEHVSSWPIVKLLLRFNENAKLYLISYLFRYEKADLTIETVTEICECLLRLFAILELSDSGYSSSKFKTFLFSENVKLVDSSVSLSNIVLNFDLHISNNWKKEQIIEEIYDYEKNSLIYLNEYLFSKQKGFDFDFQENTNIEHIMPVSGKHRPFIMSDAMIENEEDFLIHLNKVGNKILLEENINKSLGTDWFKLKKQSSILHKTGYKDSCFGIASTLTSFPKDVWTKQDIELATQKAISRIVGFIFKSEDV